MIRRGLGKGMGPEVWRDGMTEQCNKISCINVLITPKMLCLQVLNEDFKFVDQICSFSILKTCTWKRLSKLLHHLQHFSVVRQPFISVLHVSFNMSQLVYLSFVNENALVRAKAKPKALDQEANVASYLLNMLLTVSQAFLSSLINLLVHFSKGQSPQTWQSWCWYEVTSTVDLKLKNLKMCFCCLRS